MSHIFQRYLYNICLFFLLLNLQVLCGDSLQDTFHLDKMIVYGSPINQQPSRSTLIMEDFVNKYTDVPSLLQTQPGILIRQAGGLGEYADVSVRGTSGNQVSVYINDIPLSNVAGAVDLSKIPLGGIQQIDIYKNAAPFAIAGEGLGSAIRINTIPGKPLAYVNGALGSYGLFEMQGLISQSKNSYSLFLDGSHTGATNDYPYFLDYTDRNPDDGSISKKENNEYKSLNIISGGRYEFRKHGVISTVLHASDYKKNLYIPFISTASSDGYQTGTSFSIDQRFLTSQQKAFTGSLNLFTTYNHSIMDDLHGLYGGLTLHTDEMIVKDGLTAICNYDLNSSFTIGTRASLTYDKYQMLHRTDSLVPYADRLTVLGSIRTLTTFPNLSIELQYTHSYAMDQTNGVFLGITFIPDSMKTRNHLPDAELITRWRPVTPFTLDMDAGYHVRNPGFDEKFGKSASYIGNTTLKPERRVSTSLGGTVDFAKTRNSLSLFTGVTYDKILQVRNAQMIFRPDNYTAVTTLGGEWDLIISPCDFLTFHNGFTIMNNRFTDMPDKSLDGNSEPLMPSLKNNTSVTFTIFDFALTHTLYCTSPYFVSIENVRQITNKPVLSLSLDCTAIPYVTLSYKLNNYLDVQNYDYPDYPQPGRLHTLYLTISSLDGRKHYVTK